MRRIILTMILVPSLVFGQETTLANGAKQESGFPEGAHRSYLIVTPQRAIRCGSAEKVVIHFFLSPTYIVSPYEPSSDFVPLKVEFEESEGINATSFHFDSDWRKHFTFHDEAMRGAELVETRGRFSDTMTDNPQLTGSDINTRDQRTPRMRAPSLIANDTRVRVLSPTFGVSIRLVVSKAALLGPRLLHGKITYQPIFENGVLPPQQMELTLPLTVIDRNENTPRPQGPQKPGVSPHAGSKHDKIWLILLSPVLVAYFFLETLVCMVSFGEDCTC